MNFGKIKYNNEILSGALFMIASAILWLLIPQQIQSLEKGMVTASTVPRIAIGGLFICALLLFVQGLRLPKKNHCFRERYDFFPEIQERIEVCDFCFDFTGLWSAV